MILGIIESGVYGNTLVEAASARAVQRAEKTTDLGQLALLLDVVLLADPGMSLVSMANSGRISKRPILPAAKGGPASAGTPAYAWPAAHGATLLGYPSVVVRSGLDARSAPTVGRAGGADQHVAQFA